MLFKADSATYIKGVIIMSINVNMDYSTLFSSLPGASGSSSTSNLYSSLSNLMNDYAEIRNGSYSKLVKAYYAKIDSESSDSTDETEDTDSTSSSSSVTTAAQTASQIASDAKELGDAADKLSSSSSSIYDKKFTTTTNEDGTTSSSYEYDTSKITSAVKSFVKEYNSLINSTSDSMDSTTITRASFLKNITNNYSDALSQIGITVNSSTGKLSVDSDKLSSANMETVKTIFSGNNGYGSQVSTYASLIESASASQTSGSSYTNSGGYSTSGYSSITDLFA